MAEICWLRVSGKWKRRCPTGHRRVEGWRLEAEGAAFDEDEQADADQDDGEQDVPSD
jgi:hypothetical protein